MFCGSHIKHYVLCGSLLLSACTTTPETIEVRVPVPTMPAAPETLVEPPVLRVPRFSAPGSVDSIVCLDQYNIEAIKEMTSELVAREKAWRAWYDSYQPKP